MGCYARKKLISKNLVQYPSMYPYFNYFSPFSLIFHLFPKFSPNFTHLYHLKRYFHVFPIYCHLSLILIFCPTCPQFCLLLQFAPSSRIYSNIPFPLFSIIFSLFLLYFLIFLLFFSIFPRFFYYFQIFNRSRCNVACCMQITKLHELWV